MYKRAKLLICIIILLSLFITTAVACSDEDLSNATQTSPMGTIRVWVNSINNRSITGVASCIYDVDTAEYSAFVELYAEGYPAFEQSAVVSIIDYEELGSNQAYAKYDITLNIKREVTATLENGTASETLTTVDKVTSTFHFKKNAKNIWLFTSEPNPVAGNDPGEDFSLDTEDLAMVEVSFATNGGNSIDKVKVKEGSTITQPEDPVREGYIFSGWYTGQSYLEPWDFEDSVTANNPSVTLYARWLKEGASSDSTLKSQDIKANDCELSPTESNVVNATVSKDYDSDEYTFSFSTGIVFMSMTPDHWGVYLDRNGSKESSKIISLTPGETTKVYVILTAQDGFTTSIYEFRLYLKRDYTITYVENGVPIEGIEPQIVEEGSIIGSFPTIAKDGYRLVGWLYDGMTLTENRVVTQDMTISPDWEAKFVDVTLQCSGGTLNGQQNAEVRLTYGSPVGTLVGKPVRTGYSFMCWLYSGKPITDSEGKLTSVWTVYDEENVVLQARYEEEKYNISYLSVEGLEFERLESYRYGQYTDAAPYDLMANLPTKPGFEFVEWLRKDGDSYVKIEKIDSSVSGNLELKAYWQESSYTITYVTFDDTQCDYNDDTIVWKNFLTVDDVRYSYTIETPSITYTGLSFVGWYLDEDFTQKLTTSYRPVEDKYIYARWTEGFTEGLSFSLKGDSYSVSQYGGTAKAVVIPATYLNKNVVKIDANAFKNSEIESIDFTKAIHLTEIGSAAFEGCTELKEIVIPSTVTKISDGVFNGCTKLNKLTLSSWNNTTANNLGRLFGDENSASLDSYRVEQAISNSTTKTYYVPKSLKEIVINSTNITMGFAQNMTSLTSITINGVFESTTVGVCAFSGCKNLVTLVLPSNITAIGKEAFKGCESIVTITLPQSVSTIGARAFSNVKGEIIFPISLASLGDNVMEGYKGTSVDLKNIVSIGKECFKLNTNLISIDLSKVLTIGIGAFTDCNSLESVSLHQNLDKIESLTFAGCISLTNISVPTGTTIADNAFLGCDNLTINRI